MTTVPSRILAAALFIVFLLTSQTAVAAPRWVEEVIAASDSVEPHKEAEAWVLLHSAKTNISAKGGSTTHHRVAVKLLKSAGEEYCYLYEGVSDWRKVEGLKGWMITPEGKTKGLDKDNQIRLATDMAAGYYDDASLLATGFEDVQVGAVVAYEYKVKERPDWGSYCQSFVVRSSLPVLRAEFSVKPPRDWQVIVENNCDDFRETAGPEGGRIWTATGLPYMPDEPMSPPASLTEQRLMVCCFEETSKREGQFGSWEKVAKWVGETQQINAESQSDMASFAGSRFSAQGSGGSLVDSIANFVRDDIRYVAVEIGQGRFIPRQPPTTLTNRYGDCKDKTALMRSLLSHHGIPSSAVLARIEGSIEPGIPDPFQFNHAIVAIKQNLLPEHVASGPAVAEGWLLYDPTCPWTDLGWLPAELHGSHVLVADSKEWSLVEVPVLDLEANKRNYHIEGHLKADGSASLNLRIVDRGVRAARISYKRDQTADDEEIEGWRYEFEEIMPGAALTEYVTGRDGDSCWVSFIVENDNFIQLAGDLKTLSLDVVPWWALPKLKKGERVNDIWFGGRSRWHADIEWTLADSWQLELQADSVSLASPAGEFAGVYSGDDRTVSYSWTWNFSGKSIPAAEYDDARRYRNKLQRFRNTRIIVQKSPREEQ